MSLTNYLKLCGIVVICWSLVGCDTAIPLDSIPREDGSGPTITLEPDVGTAETAVTIRGTGFEGEQPVSIYLGVPGVGVVPVAYGNTLTGSDGDFSFTLEMPGQWLDGEPITETEILIIATHEDFSLHATAEFTYRLAETVSPSLILEPDVGMPGQHVTVTGQYFTPGTTAQIRLGVPQLGLDSTNLASATANEEGAFEVTITIPDAWPESGNPVIEENLVIGAVDESVGQMLAAASFRNVGDIVESTEPFSTDEPAD